MRALNESDLLAFNLQGLIPGPDENEHDFIKRAQHCLSLHQQLLEKCDANLPFDITQKASDSIIQEVLPITKELFGIMPTWVPIFFSNYQLALWHGGCAWIFQLTDESPMSALFQLRQVFATSSHYLGIYARAELVAHESAHVARMMFQEPKFEEILAYRTARTKFRRFFGPILQSAWEGILFIFSLLLVIVVDLYFIFSDHAQAYHQVMGLKMIPLVLLGAALIRLYLRQRQFSICLKKLTEILPDGASANAVIFRLQDQEVKNFTKMSLSAIESYAQESAHKSLRWRLIYKAYFAKTPLP